MSGPGTSGEPRFSDDRQWWWNGSQWVPASQAPSQPPVAAPPGALPTSSPLASPAKRGGVASWLAIVGLVVCFPVGIVLTLLTGWSSRTKAIAIGVVLALVVVGGVIGSSSSKTTPTASVSVSTPTSNPATAKSSTGVKTPSPSPAAATPSQAPKQQFVTFGNGTKVVGQDVQPGTYRTRHDSSGCYFARLKGFGGSVDDIIANDITDAPAVVTIMPTDKGFQSNNCDTWWSDLSQITTSKTSFGSGDFIVGTDMSPGTYRNTGATGCYWERLRGFCHTIDDIIANDITDNQTVVAIAASDAGFESKRCGNWTKIG